MGCGSWNGGTFTCSVDRKLFDHFSLLSSLNFMILLITLIYNYDLPCISCLNVFFCILIGISFRKGDVLYDKRNISGATIPQLKLTYAGGIVEQQDKHVLVS